MISSKKDRSRPPTLKEEELIRDLYARGLGSPKIAQMIGINSHRVLLWLKQQGMTRTREEMVTARRANGLDFHRKTIPLDMVRELYE